MDAIHELALASGDMPAVIKRGMELASAAFTEASPRRKKLALRRRAILFVAQELEGYGVSVSRWILQGAATGQTPYGAAFKLLEACNASLKPSVAELMAGAAARGGVRRREVNLLVAQCLDHFDMWRRMQADRNSSVLEFNKFGWNPLHFAAVVGAASTVRTLLSLGADATRFNGAGLTPLHLAMTHGSAEAAALIAAHAPSAVNLASPKIGGRTPADAAIHAGSGRIDWCCRMLLALGERQGERQGGGSSSSIGGGIYGESCVERCKAGAPASYRVVYDGRNDYLEERAGGEEGGDEDEDEDEDEEGDGAEGRSRGTMGFLQEGRGIRTAGLRRRGGDCDVARGLHPSDLLFEHVVLGRPVIVPSRRFLPPYAAFARRLCPPCMPHTCIVP